VRTRAALAALVTLLLAAPAHAAVGVDLASSYGSGHLGRWETDALGLPRFRYDVDETTDPRAKQPELAGGTLAQHQLGNDHIVANAYNDGYTQLWSQDREPQWANLYQAGSRHYGGGYGYLNVGGRVFSTSYVDAASKPLRWFGVGYHRRDLRAAGLDVQEDVYAPFGDDPLLLHDVTVTNTTRAPIAASWFEYWDVNPYYQTTGFQRNIAMDAPTWDDATKTLLVAQTGAPEADTDPLAIFAAALKGPVADHEASVARFFGDGTRAAPAEVQAGRLSNTLPGATPDGQAGDVMFSARAPLDLKPGEKVTLRYAYGMAHPAQVPKLVAKYRAAADPFATSERAWADWVPQADFGAAGRWVARELAWDAYLLRSASVYEEVCGHHTITQGGYYQYVNGANLGYRSWLHYALPITYTAPELAREILRYAIQWQPEASNQNPYGTGPLCQRVDLGSSNDLDFWLLLAAGEYGLGMRDTKFFDEQLPFWDTKRKVSAWEHIKLAFAHQESLLGPHGGYVMGATGDWSDFATEFLQATESMLVTAQTAYAYPKLAELADLRGDTGFAARLRAAGARDLATLRREWTGKGWYSRGYSGDRQIGQGVLFEEPQPWALLAGAASPAQQDTLVANIRRFLGGVGAPRGPARFGSAMVPARDDPDITERGPTIADSQLPTPDILGTFAFPNAPLQNAAEWPGGVWFDLNGDLVWAYTALDRRADAWDEYTRNTLATHATLWPDHWDGTISVDDACYGYYSDHPENCGNGLTTAYEGQITEQPTWMVMNAIRLAGLTVTRDGYDVFPHLPFRDFSLTMPQIGITSEPRRLHGYLRPASDAAYGITVHLPPDAKLPDVTTWVDGRAVPHTASGRAVRFAAHGRADWEVTWGTTCASRRRFAIRLRGPRGERLRAARVVVAGKLVKVRGRRYDLRATVDLRGRPKERTTVRIAGRTRAGRRVTAVRRYRLCVPSQTRRP
jgi:glycosyl hydrolase family 36/glycosyl transferase family 36